ncbi:hypothetical protein B0T17DRAFT_511359 [Bombardia bombarda]|uniref:Diphthine--ammonia ligase n=1 Tax=Bombardia bombarda TaxID=252184 RepID=A0AA39WB03_9PEZI|nr:hypothetical protein B0T17DRAFT_511359 [Bombardia bombarda]
MAAAGQATQPPQRDDSGLNVIALISGGKDSFFSLLHCRANGHRVVALANLHPGATPPPARPSSLSKSNATISHGDGGGGDGGGQGLGQGQSQPADDPVASAPVPSIPGNELNEVEEEEDLNSFMYQTVGHQVIPLYAEATGIPLYRQPIIGGAGRHGKDYSYSSSKRSTDDDDDDDDNDDDDDDGGGNGVAEDAEDETESMVPLLRAVMAAHPEANAICAGAILSTYQRTRVESVATRLGLVPLAYLWKFSALPTPSVETGVASDAQLLDDMAAVGIEARIVKVASGGLDDSFLWTNVASAAGRDKVARAMRRFGALDGVGGGAAVIGEGGSLRRWWLMARGVGGGRLVDKGEDAAAAAAGDGEVRIPGLLDARFVSVLDALETVTEGEGAASVAMAHDQDQQQPQLSPQQPPSLPHLGTVQTSGTDGENKLLQWCFTGDAAAMSQGTTATTTATTSASSIKAETESLMQKIRQQLQHAALPPSAIISTTIVLRRMADFPAVNAVYGALFDDAPNPPSRVTVSCGDLLSSSVENDKSSSINIAVYLTVHSGLGTGDQQGQRQGLHVQSRSYWAPANIGPYSQAVAIPLGSLSFSPIKAQQQPRLVNIAGQIPLVPATMALPAGDDTLKLQLALSLQHLWRIGTEMGVRWWTGAVVYFPSSGGGSSGVMRSRAKLAGRTWEAAHLWGVKGGGNGDGEDDEDEEDDDDGPDLWDRKFNPQYMSFTGEQDKEKLPTLPDWDVLDGGKQSRAVPPLFVAEVAELPRAAGVEWHAHLGIAGASEKSIITTTTSAVSGQMVDGDDVSVYQTIVRLASDSDGGGRLSFVQTIVTSSASSASRSFRDQDSIAEAAVAKLGSGDQEPVSSSSVTVVMRYVDVIRSSDLVAGGSAVLEPVMPCASLWDAARGERLASVTVYQSVFEEEAVMREDEEDDNC